MHDAQRWTALAVLAISLAGCAGDEDDLSRDLFEKAVADGKYKAWSQFPGAEPALIKSATHNGDYVRSYMNPVAVEAIKNFTGEFPEDTILVKEQFADAVGEMKTGHTVMWKVPGYDDAHGDWYWVAYNAKGETTTHNGMAPYCIDCHKSAPANNDWVYTNFR